MWVTHLDAERSITHPTATPHQKQHEAPLKSSSDFAHDFRLWPHVWARCRPAFSAKRCFQISAHDAADGTQLQHGTKSFPSRRFQKYVDTHRGRMSRWSQPRCRGLGFTALLQTSCWTQCVVAAVPATIGRSRRPRHPRIFSLRAKWHNWLSIRSDSAVAHIWPARNKGPVA